MCALRGDLSAIRDILAELAEDDTPGWSTAPAVLLLQEVNEGDQVTIRNCSMEISGTILASPLTPTRILVEPKPACTEESC